MPLPGSGPLALSAIETEFGGSPPTSISEYYGVAGGVPSSGQIAFSNFYGTTNARGVFGGGYNATPGAIINSIEYISIQSTGNAQDFGDLGLPTTELASCASSTRGIFAGGSVPGQFTNIINYITISSIGNATDFGDLTFARTGSSGVASPTRGCFGNAYSYPGTPGAVSRNCVIDYITIATTGNAINFGNLLMAGLGFYHSMGCSSPTRGVWGSSGPTYSNRIDYITIATTGNSIDFGDLTVARGNRSGSCSSSTRGIWAGGSSTPPFIRTNIIDYITIASTGNATDFGDLTSIFTNLAGCSSPTRGVFSGGFSVTSVLNTIQYITIASTGNAIDFGDLITGRQIHAACSNTHGGVT